MREDQEGRPVPRPVKGQLVEKGFDAAEFFPEFQEQLEEHWKLQAQSEQSKRVIGRTEPAY